MGYEDDPAECSSSMINTAVTSNGIPAPELKLKRRSLGDNENPRRNQKRNKKRKSKKHKKKEKCDGVPYLERWCLGELPRVFVLQLTWPQHPTKEQRMACLQLCSEDIDVGKIFCVPGDSDESLLKELTMKTKTKTKRSKAGTHKRARSGGGGPRNETGTSPS